MFENTSGGGGGGWRSDFTDTAGVISVSYKGNISKIICLQAKVIWG